MESITNKNLRCNKPTEVDNVESTKQDVDAKYCEST